MKSTQAEPLAIDARPPKYKAMSRMIGRWPDGIHFEDALVPKEGLFRGVDREVPGVWPQSSLSSVGHIARRK